MLGRLIDEAAGRFDLEDQAAALVTSLLSMIGDREHGRIGGFLDAFREEGMEREVESWVAEGPVRELTAEEVATGLGPAPIGDLAARLGLDPGRIAAALGFLIPHVLDLLTPGGEVPDDEALLARIDGWLAGSTPVAAAGSAAAAPVPPARLAAPVPPARTAAPVPPARTAAPAPQPAVRRRRGLVGVVALIALLALVWLAARWYKTDESLPPQSRVDAESPRSASQMARTPPRQQPRQESAAEREEPARTAANGVEAPAPAPEPEPLAFDAAAATDEAQGEALDALSALGADFSPTDLVAALNRGTITFAAESAAVTPASRELLERAAATILAAPSQIRLEIAGHTDSHGVERRNLVLSQARAEAVRNTLLELGVPRRMLIPRGYGSSQPVADNATQEGRFRNRRIEFVVVGGG
jgi:outer membrane protein OmpA-like peptidoglycan-associated protein/uncharacterized protein YidB (DUF937 family)